MSEDSQNSCIEVDVDPGVCGFHCRLAGSPGAKRTVALEITHSECRQVRKLASLLEPLSLRDTLAPNNSNPVFRLAHQANCHPSCVVPVALVKLAEVVLGLALPREVRITFRPAEPTRDSSEGDKP